MGQAGPLSLFGVEIRPIRLMCLFAAKVGEGFRSYRVKLVARGCMTPGCQPSAVQQRWLSLANSSPDEGRLEAHTSHSQSPSGAAAPSVTMPKLQPSLGTWLPTLAPWPSAQA